MHLFLTSEDDNAIWVACQGEIGQASFPANIHDPLEDLLGAACYQRQVVVDLGQASFIDSSGISWLLACHQRFLAKGGKLILHSVPPMIDQVLRLLRLHGVLTILADQSAARAAVAAKGKA